MTEPFTYIQAAVLGLVQGITEFLPISSSGHLVVVREVLGWPDQGLFFDMILHFATLFAVLTYFWRDWVDLVSSVRKVSISKAVLANRQQLLLIGIANIPAVVGGLLFIGMVEGPARSTLSVAILMIVVALLFLVMERLGQGRRDITKFNIYDAISIGMAQLAAIVPGVSRSGATILAGMYQGLKREAAAKVSFLIGAPAILMAGSYSLLQLVGSPLPDTDWLFLGVGFLTAFLSGYLAIKFMMAYLRSRSLAGFAYYRIGVGIILLIITLFDVSLPWRS